MANICFELLSCSLILAGGAFHLHAQLPEPNRATFDPGVLPRQGATGGPKCMEMPEWQIHEYNPDLYILRQSGCTDYEKPFVHLLFGEQSALLMDTGSHRGNLAPTPLAAVKKWLTRLSANRFLSPWCIHILTGITPTAMTPSKPSTIQPCL